MSHDSTRPPAWVADACFYQIFPDRFAMSPTVPKPDNLEPWDTPPSTLGYKGGDLVGVLEHLDWLTDLGVDAIYLNPIFQSGANHRYHTHDYHHVDPLLGGDEAFRRLLDGCHDRGMKVVLDGVFNHSGRGLLQFHDIAENGEHSPYVHWYHIHEFPIHPYEPDEPANYEAWWGLRALPKFDTDHPATREFLMQVGEHWARLGIDGWRLDVPEEIHTEGFWEEFRSRVKAINPECYIVGEIWGDASAWVNGGTRFDGTMNYRFGAATIAYAIGSSFDHTTRLANPHYAVTPAIDAARYRDRVLGLIEGYDEGALLANLNVLDSHDTARILTMASHDVDRVVLSLVLLYTFPGAPCLYYGTEIGLEGHKDPDNRRTFPWEHPERWNDRLHRTVKELIALRKAHPALRGPGYRPLWPADDGDGTMVYGFERFDDAERVVVLVNAGDATEAGTIPYRDLGADHAELLWGHADVDFGDHHLRVSVPPRTAAVWSLDVTG